MEIDITEEVVTDPNIKVPRPEPLPAEAARARIALLEREARAQGSSVVAAVLFHEAGLLWEYDLKQPRNAAVAYQSAFKLAPRFLANLRAARRLFAEVGNWAMVVQLLDAELAAVDGGPATAALLFEKGEVLARRLSRQPEADAVFARCLALEPGDLSLLFRLEQHFLLREDHASLVKVYLLLAGGASADSTRAGYLTAAGTLLEDRLGDVPRATRCFREAFALDRTDPVLVAAMKRVAQREGTVDEELAALAAEADGQGALAAPILLEISRAYERLGRNEDALAALAAARQASPDDPLVFAELARLHEGLGHWEPLAEVLTAWAALPGLEEQELVAVNLRLAALYEGPLAREEAAMACYRAILARVPGQSTALAGRGKLAFRLQRWDELVATYRAEAGAAEDARSRAGKLYKAAEALEERLGNAEEAVALYLECLEVVPGYLPAHKALVRLFEKHGRYQELIAIYERDLLQAADLEEQISTLHRMAALHEDRLRDNRKAMECLRRVLELAPDRISTLRHLGRLCELEGEWAQVLELCETEARLSGDQKQIVSLAHRSAEILEVELKDRPGAIAAWERVLSLAPTYIPALRALGRLHGQDQRWDALVRMYRAEAEISPQPQVAAALLMKVGELFETQMKDEGQAIDAYREVLATVPGHPPALRALERIHRRRGAWAQVVEVLEAEAEASPQRAEKAQVLFQAASLHEDQLGDASAAIRAYQAVLEVSPTHAPARQRLERLLTARDDVAALTSLLEQQMASGTPAARVSAALRLARLQADRLGEPVAAAASCAQALALDPTCLGALHLLRRLKGAQGAPARDVRDRLAQASADERFAGAMRVALALDAEDVGPSGLRALRGAFEKDPTDQSLTIALERTLLRSDDAAGLVALYERQRSSATDSAELLQLSMRVADLAERQLGDLELAEEAYRRAVESAPELYPALWGLARCQARLGRFAESRASMERAAAAAREPATATFLLLDAARLARDEEKDLPAAAALLQAVLARDPLHPEAGPALEELLARQGGADQLAQLKLRRGAARLAQKDPLGAGEAFFEAARIYLEQLKDRAQALASVDRALMAVPTSADALELKAQLSLEDKAYADAAAALAVRVQQPGEPAHLAQLQLKLGSLYQDHLSDTPRATAFLQAALALDPTNLETLERLASAHLAARNWTAAAEVLQRLVDEEPSPLPRARHALALARVAEDGFADAARATAMYRLVLELIPGETQAIDRLAALYERLGSLPELLQLLETASQRVGDVKKLLALKMRLGTTAARLDDVGRAQAAFRQALEIDPAHVPAHVELAQLYGRDPGLVSMAIESHRTLLRLEPLRLDSLHALFKAWESLRQPDKAFCAAGLLVFFKAATEAEAAFYNEARARLPVEFKNSLGPPDLVTLHHAWARSPLVDVLRAVGDQFGKLYPPDLEGLGIDKRSDRLKPDSAVGKALYQVTDLFGVEVLEAYQARKGLVQLETGEPLAVCLGPEVSRRLNLREQRFLFGRAALGLVDRAALLRKLPAADVADVLGNAVRILHPQATAVGRRNEEQSRTLKRAFSRRALKELQEPADAVASASDTSAEQVVQGLLLSQDRAGLLACGDVSVGLTFLLREEPYPGQPRPETQAAVLQAVAMRPEVKDLIGFCLTEDFFRLRNRIGQTLG